MKPGIPSLLAGTLLLLGAGCASPSRPAYPLGIYSVPSTTDLPVVRAAGFNLVTGPAQFEFLNAARAAGLKVLTPVPPFLHDQTRAAPTPNPALVALDAHPALWAWELCDEPDLNLVPPAEVRRLQKTLRRSGARKPTTLTLSQGPEAFHYGFIPEILLVDRYPVPWLPLANLGQHVRMARLARGKDTPLIAVIQAFDWSAYPGLLSRQDNLRPPTYEELRCMTYEALARGATGLFYYQFDGPWKIRDHPQVWLALQAVVREVNERQPLFRGQPLWWAKDFEFQDPDCAFNAALESSVTSTLLRVARGNRHVPAGDYILAVNNTPRHLSYSFALPWAGTEGARSPVTLHAEADSSHPPESLETTSHEPEPLVKVFGEERALNSEAGWVREEFAPYAVHVYGPLAEPPNRHHGGF